MKKVTGLVSALELMVGLSCIWGGYKVLTNSINLPTSLLIDSPFDSYFWPGVILVFVVGGTYLLAALTLFNRSRFMVEMQAVAGFGLMIWIFVEIYIIKHTMWLQILYFFIGVLTVLNAMQLLKYGKKYLKSQRGD